MVNSTVAYYAEVRGSLGDYWKLMDLVQNYGMVRPMWTDLMGICKWYSAEACLRDFG